MGLLGQCDWLLAQHHGRDSPSQDAVSLRMGVWLACELERGDTLFPLWIWALTPTLALRQRILWVRAGSGAEWGGEMPRRALWLGPEGSVGRGSGHCAVL